MKLSVIVPVYKAEPYLEECVDSLLGQSLGNLEIILVDDGSPDHSGEIADRYAESHPDIVRSLHVENGGQGRARNIALKQAMGDYLGFVDSDDWVAPDMYEKLFEKCEETGADIAVCDWMEVFPDGRTAVLPACYQKNKLSAAGSACNKIFKRKLLRDTEFPEGLWYEDFYFSAMLMMRAGKIAYVEEPLYYYRQSPVSTMRNNNASKNLDLLRILDLLEDPMNAAGLHDEFEFFIINHVLLDGVNRVCAQDTADRVETIESMLRYVHEKIPRLSRCRRFCEESRNRRVIMRLNYLGFYELSRTILKVSSRL